MYPAVRTFRILLATRSGHRRGHKFPKSGALRELPEPTFEMGKPRLPDSLDAKPTPGISAQRDIRDRKVIAFDEASRRQFTLHDEPLFGFGVGVLLDFHHVALLGRGPYQGPEHRPIDGLQRRKCPVQPAVDTGATLRWFGIERRSLAISEHEIAHD